MPANRRQQSTQSPISPTAQTTAKYTNKDGSKFITVPKVFSSADSPQPSPTMVQPATKANGQVPQAPQDSNSGAIGVNRKKQKRRQKQAEAARLAAGQPATAPATNGTSHPSQDRLLPPDEYQQEPIRYYASDGSRLYYNKEGGDKYSRSPANGYSMPPDGSKSSKEKGKGKALNSDQHDHSHRTISSPHRENSHASSVPAPLKTGMSKEKIWNTSSQEERERIKLFWLSLGEEERRSLVKVEKDAVLKKMKEQQKHSCSCTVCGRKRVAIEEELEVLYDAYYEELEQYANNQQGDAPPAMMAAARRFGPLGGLQPPNRLPLAFSGRQPSRGKIVEHFDNDDDEDGEDDLGDEEYSEDDCISDEDPREEISRNHATDFFNFGQSLTVQGGILTVADDLLKNDGKKFIEMMEQLAERRMAREEDAKEQLYSAANGYGHPPNGSMQSHNHHGHLHPPPPEDEDYDEEEDEEDEYDSQDDEYDEEEMDTMTEEQRMEEGRRMFQIFAARMFEQRVLTAYKEKVAAERQEKLIQELDEENLAAVQKKAKKAKDAQKKKEKAQQKKLALAEEKLKREAEKAAEEAALRATEEKKAEETRLKAEEKRKKREAQKKAEEEERARKEADKHRRLQEQRERQAEIERKQREAKEREKREKEEVRLKEKEVREAKERETRERKEKQEKERREMEAKTKAEKEANDLQKRQEQAVQLAAAASHAQTTKRQHQHISIPIPAGLQPAQSFVSPHVPVATPVMPKAPTPNRPSATSQRDLNSVPQTPQVGKSQSTSPNSSTPQQSSPGPIGNTGKVTPQQPFLHHPQATSPIHAALKGPPSSFQPGPFHGMQPMGINGFHPGMPMMAPGFGARMHHDPMYPHQQTMNNQFRPLSGPNGMPMHPGMSGMPLQQGRGFPVQHAPPGFPQHLPNGPMAGMGPTFGGHKEAGTATAHSRQQSASFDKPPFDGMTTQPISRPGPIGRPSSVVHGQRSTENNQSGQNDIDDLSNQLGSSALLDDSDDQLSSPAGTRRASAAPGGIGRQGFPSNGPFGMDPSGFSNPLGNYNAWAGPSNPYGASSLPGANYMAGWGTTNVTNFGAVGAGGGPHRPSQPRSVAVRQMLCRACKNLEGSSPDGFHNINAIREQIDHLNPSREEPISEKEILDLCETEGNSNNGGGYFDLRHEGDGRTFIRYEPDVVPSNYRAIGAPGDIGSPVVGSSTLSRFPGPPSIPTPGGF